MNETVVDRLYNEFQYLVSYLDRGGEISLRNTADENFRKALLLAAASYFERRICDDLLVFFNEMSSQNLLLVEFVKNKAISRQYHTFFQWELRNANQFFGLFGDSFKIFMGKEVKGDEELDEAIKAFLEIGNERNRLVHQDFGTFFLEKTVDEIYQRYKTALRFVEAIPNKLRQCLLQSRTTGEQGRVQEQEQEST
ncbi:hypothetical protein HYR99_14285 [Candidatus Poribacteria bacterium]|nr:hypothetical protein [Candidatus Poribacteria bacterium]